MYWYAIRQTLTPLDAEPAQDEAAAAVLLTSEELYHQPKLSGLEKMLHHTPAARDARVCKAEVRSDCLTGTLVVPRTTRSGKPLACGYLITHSRIVLVDDSGALQSHLKHIVKEKLITRSSTGRFLYNLLEMLITKDLHHLEELEDQVSQLEDRVLSGHLEQFSSIMRSLRKESISWFRYYTQLDDVACELTENENGFFSDDDLRMFHMYAHRIGRLREESQLLREYCTQLQTMFQSEIDIRQNRIMKILTIVTTIFLPLSLLAGWYGMNFKNMPELEWQYGYPAVILVSLVIVFISLLVCKKKKFW